MGAGLLAGAASATSGATPPAPVDSLSAPASADTSSAGAREGAEAEPDTSLATGTEETAAQSDSATKAPRPQRTLRPTARFDRPRWVMLRSLLVPGWGQAHNHAWIKAALVAFGDGTLRVRMVRDEQHLRSLNRQASGRLGELKNAVADTTAAGQAYAEAVLSGDQQRIDAAFEARAEAYEGLRLASDAYNGVVGLYNTLLSASTNRRWLAAGVIAYALLDAYIDAHFRTFDVDFQLDPALPEEHTPAGARLRIGWRF